MARALLLCVGLAAVLHAQTAPQPLRGYLCGPSGAGVADALVQFLADPTPELPAVAGLSPPPPCRNARTDQRGLFAIDGLTGSGALLATTASGLGAFADRCRPGVPLPRLQPMAEVSLPGRSEEFALWAAWIGVDGGRRFLPPLQGTAIRLPAGSYEVWYQLGDGFHWARLELRSGKHQDLPFASAAQRLQRRSGAKAHPSGWPQIELFPGEAQLCSLYGDAAMATFTTLLPGAGAVIAERQLPHGGGQSPQTWPPQDAAVGAACMFLIERAGEAVPFATAWLLRQQPRADRWLPLGFSRADQNGALTLPRPAASADCWLLVTAPGCAPFGTAWDALPPPHVIALQPERKLAVTCTAATVVDDVRLEFEPRDAVVALQRCYTDTLGRAQFAVGAQGGRLLVSDPRFANAEVAVAGNEEGVRLALAAGAPLHGRAVLAGDLPAALAVVTLRDPQGLLRPAERTSIAGADGSFSFTGLDGDAEYVLFAQQRRSGRTWSGKLSRARADGNRYLVELRCEDPELPRGPGR